MYLFACVLFVDLSMIKKPAVCLQIPGCLEFGKSAVPL